MFITRSRRNGVQSYTVRKTIYDNTFFRSRLDVKFRCDLWKRNINVPNIRKIILGGCLENQLNSCSAHSLDSDRMICPRSNVLVSTWYPQTADFLFVRYQTIVTSLNSFTAVYHVHFERSLGRHNNNNNNTVVCGSSETRRRAVTVSCNRNVTIVIGAVSTDRVSRPNYVFCTRVSNSRHRAKTAREKTIRACHLSSSSRHRYHNSRACKTVVVVVVTWRETIGYQRRALSSILLTRAGPASQWPLCASKTNARDELTT